MHLVAIMFCSDRLWFVLFCVAFFVGQRSLDSWCPRLRCSVMLFCSVILLRCYYVLSVAVRCCSVLFCPVLVGSLLFFSLLLFAAMFVLDPFCRVLCCSVLCCAVHCCSMPHVLLRSVLLLLLSDILFRSCVVLFPVCMLCVGVVCAA